LRFSSVTEGSASVEKPDAKRWRVIVHVEADGSLQLWYSNPPMGAPSRGRSGRRDPFERTMEAALRPGQFIRYGESFAFVQDLERIARSIDGLAAEALRVRQICSRPSRGLLPEERRDRRFVGWVRRADAAPLLPVGSGAPGGRLVRRRDGRDLASLEGAGPLRLYGPHAVRRRRVDRGPSRDYSRTTRKRTPLWRRRSRK
jgi:hypothetical protein